MLVAAPGLLRAPARAAGPMWSASLARDGVSWGTRIQRHADESWFSTDLAVRAASILRRVVAGRLGSTWWGQAPRVDAAGRCVIFATGDQKATHGLVARALEDAGAAGCVLVAPRPGRLGMALARRGVRVVDGVVDPWPLIEGAATVYAAPGSDAALIAGLTGTRVGGGAPADPVRLVASHLVLGTRYADPFSGRPLSCEAFLDLMEEWRGHAAADAEIACCVGISFWKRRRVSEVLGAARPPAFRRTARAAVAVAVRRGGGIAVWPSRQPPGLEALAGAAGVALSRIEDGFVRSVGLGAEFRPPLSMVLDRLGLYYDATGPSDLERILAGTRFDAALLARASALRLRMVREGVTKYNLAGAAVPLEAPPGRVVVLVPGQVADDRSVVLGGGGVGPGLDLLARVRAACPDGFIVYKPHPDVEAGFRPGAVPDAEVLRFADRVVRGGSMAALLDVVDEVHTLTSLTGFEALLRGRRVTTYGRPFYAGWGLTADLNPPPGRARAPGLEALSLDGLVAGALILYPRYFDPVSSLPCGPEIAMDRIADPALHRLTPLMQLRRWQGALLHAVRRIRMPRRARAPLETPRLEGSRE